MKEMPDKIYDRKSRLEAYGIPSVNLPYKSNCHRSQCLIGRFLWKRNGMHFSVFLQRASASENRRKIYNLIGRGVESNDTFSTKKILCHMSSIALSKKAVKNRLLWAQNSEEKMSVSCNADLSVWKFVPNWPHVYFFLYKKTSKNSRESCTFIAKPIWILTPKFYRL